MSDVIPLEVEDVHLWYVLMDRVAETQFSEFEALLSSDERQRRDRFRQEEQRRHYLVSHGFLRLVLSRYAPIEPQEWDFRPNRLGKPLITAPASQTHLCFNLTHTTGLAACVVARAREVGVDAEELERRGRDISDALIRGCLAPAEREYLFSLAPEERKAVFLTYWTLKEAYLKARGVGLSLPLEDIAFSWDEDRVEVRFTSRIADESDTWQFGRMMVGARHRIAVAMRSLGGTPLTVKVYNFLER